MSAPDDPRRSSPSPPRAAAWLLRAILPADGAEPILGDLEELLVMRAPRVGARRARLWYWRQAIGLLVSRPAWQPMRRQMPVRRTTAMAALVQDVSYAFRALSKQIGFTATAVLTLALGIGANLAIFSLVYAVLIRPLPFRDPGELMLVHLLMPERGEPGVFNRMIWSYPKYEIVRDRQQVFTDTALFNDREWSLTNTTSPERLGGEIVETSYFGLLGVGARVGRTFGAAEDRAGAPPTAVISYGLWQRRYGADPNVLGKAIDLDRTPFTIIGVAPPGFRGVSGRADVWRPMMTTDPSDLVEPHSHSYYQLARRKPGVSAEQADAAVRVLGAQVNEAYPHARNGVAPSATAVPIDDERVDPILRRAAMVLLGAVALVLLIGCVNLANLTLARGLARRREVAIRLALGASRLRIVRQFLTESLVLSLAGAALGVLVAFVSIRLATAALPDLGDILDGPAGGLTRVAAGMLGVDPTMAMVAVGLAVLTALLFGLAPAWQAARRDLTTAIRPGSAGSVSAGFRGVTFRNVLVVAELALALVMLVSAGLMLKSMARLSATDLGFRPDRLVTFRLALPDTSYPTPERRLQFIEQLLAKLKARSEIEAAAFGHCAPVSGGCNGTLALFPDRPPAPRGSEPLVGVTWASPDYFSTLGIRLVRGRWFTDRDRVGQPKVVVVNETAARRFWKEANPIGQRLGLGQGGFRDGAEVIGVVADVRYRSVETPPGPDTYIPLLQSPRPMGLFFVKSRVPSSTLLPVVREQLAALDRDLPMSDVKTMDERYGEATWRTWTIGTLLTLFASLAVVLALVGIFGVLAQAVAQRTREIGVRMALGADRGDILRLVLGRASVMAALGVGAGLLASWFAMRLLTTLLYEVRPDDPTVLVALAALLFAVALAASYIPAHRATRVDPLETLRVE
jgi:putative ABC transport system permease protein